MQVYDLLIGLKLDILFIFNTFYLCFIGIDTDKYKYPIGSGRVTFSTYQSYTKAVAASFVEVKTPKFCKVVS